MLNTNLLPTSLMPRYEPVLVALIVRNESHLLHFHLHLLLSRLLAGAFASRLIRCGDVKRTTMRLNQCCGRQRLVDAQAQPTQCGHARRQHDVGGRDNRDLKGYLIDQMELLLWRKNIGICMRLANLQNKDGPNPKRLGEIVEKML